MLLKRPRWLTDGSNTQGLILVADDIMDYTIRAELISSV
jgi:hypothetical protein